MRKIHSKDTLLRSGLNLVLSKGFNATGVEAILKQAKIPRGSFYNFFSSKEEFGLALIDVYAAKVANIVQESFLNESLHPLERIRESFERLIDIFEKNGCEGGCLLANLSLEMANTSENIRIRLDAALRNWASALTAVVLGAQKDGAIPEDLDAETLAENMIQSYQGALLLAKVKKTSEPLKNFMFMYFDVFLAQSNRK